MVEPFTQAILLAVTAASSVGSIYASSKASSAQAKASKAGQRQQALQAAVARRREIAQGREAAAKAVQAGENQGAAGSSGVQGGVGSLKTQLNANLSFLDRSNQDADIASGFLAQAGKWQQVATTVQGIGQLASVGYGALRDASAAAAAAKQQAAYQAQIFGVDANGNKR